MNAASGRTFVGVQVLRGIAAMLVVLCHASQMVHYRLGQGEVLFFGASGVDVFFPISGFVMAVTTYRYWGQAGHAVDFLVRRLIRIVPIYWGATLLKLLLMVALPALAGKAWLDPWHITASFLFIPAFDADHKPLPVVPIGWTLNYEMLFYLLFAAVLALRLHPLRWLGGGLLLLSLLPAWPALGAIATLFSPMLLEFVGGMVLGWASLQGWRLPRGLAPWALALALLALVLTQLLTEQICFGWRLALWGVPGLLALAATLATEPAFTRWAGRWPERLGDASYAIYLSHGFMLPAVGVLALKLGLTTAVWRWPIMLGCCVLAAVLGHGVHRHLERPLTDRLSRHWRARQARAPG